MANGFGIGSAMSKAYSLVEDPSAATDRETARRLEFRTAFIQDQEREKQAQREMAAYEDKISEFADSLLAPDREKINRRAKLLAMGIKENVKNMGGLKHTQFMANGGGAIMQDYKSNVINSDESNIYLQNKKNSEALIKAQMSKMGHLINARDLKSLQDYQRNGGGEITFTGLLSEIQMPDPNAYKYGTDIPASDILENNYMAILGNYMTEYPDKPKPTQAELLTYTGLRYGAKGTSQVEMNHELKKIQEENNKIKELFNMQLQLNRATPNGQQTNTGANQSPYSRSNNKSSDDNYIKSNNSSIVNAERYLNTQARTVKDWTSGSVTEETLAKGLGELVGASKWNQKFRTFNPDEKGWDWALGANAMLNFGNTFSLANGERLYNGSEGQILRGALNLDDEDDSYDSKNKILRGYRMPSTGGVYMANGAELDVELERPADYKILAVVKGGVASNADGSALVMDVHDGDKKLSHEEAKTYVKYDENDIVKPSLLIAMEEIGTGNVYYQDIGIENPQVQRAIQVNLGELDDLTPVMNQKQDVLKEEAQVEALNSQQVSTINALRQSFQQNNTAYKNMVLEIDQYTPVSGYSEDRAKLIEAFYIVNASMGISSLEDQLAAMNNLTQSTFLTNGFLPSLQQNTGIDFMNLFRKNSKDLSNDDLIRRMMDADPDGNEQFYRQLQATYKFL